MGSSVLVCEKEGGLSLASLRVFPSPPLSCSKLARVGRSSLFPLHLGWGQIRERLRSTMYPHVCPTVLWGLKSLGGAVLGPAQDMEGDSQEDLWGLRLFWPIIMPFVHPWEFVVWKPITCASGKRGQERQASVFTHCPFLLPPSPACDRWLHLQHVCCEPGPLSALPRLQEEGPAGIATPGPLHIKGGREEAQTYTGFLILISSQLSLRPARSCLPRPISSKASLLPSRCVLSNQGGSHSPCLLSRDEGGASSAVDTVHTLFTQSVVHGPAASVSPGHW